MYTRNQAGFTLIEITLVMAISAALAAIALLGFSTLRGQAQFSATIEQLDQTVLAKRQEALSTVKLSGGANSANITIGRLITFIPNSSIMKVQTLYTANVSAPANGQPVLINAAEDQTIDIPWGITYAGLVPIQVAFIRSATDGSLQTAISTGWSANLIYGDFAPGGVATNLNFTDPSGRKAHLTIDPSNNSVTRSFP